MATGKRRTRPLSLGGRRFRWRCEFSHPLEVFSAGYEERGASWPPDTLVVRPEDGPHGLLTVTWPACEGPVVTPGMVRSCVEEALRRGWLAELPVLKLPGLCKEKGGR
jgi:hypothetical protein